MNHSTLKKLRVGVSILFLVSTGLLFIDINQWLTTDVISKITYFQFVPSLISFLGSPAVATTGFILVVVLSLFAGRIYCSSICPLGILQDVISFTGSRSGKKRVRYKYKKPQTWVRYPILVLTALVLIFGSTWLLLLLDPYSNFGRIVNNLFRPIYLALNNAVAITLESAGVYSVARIDWKGISLAAFLFSFFVLIVLVLMSWRRGRLFCNTICPVGTLLGVLSKASLYKIRFDKAACTQCGKCGVVCKSECIDVKSKEVDFDRCVGCFNCLLPCEFNGIRYKPSWKKETGEGFSGSKRNFLRSAGTLLLWFTATAAWAGVKVKSGRQAKKVLEQKNKEGMIPVPRENHSIPPGAANKLSYTSKCTACQLCASACPTQVLRPAVGELGLFWIMVPFMDYETSFCNFECTRCTEVCPTGAISPLDLVEKKRTQLGKAKFIKQNCIVETDGTACGACSEHCPTKAVKMVPYKEKLTIPEVTDKICIGCGACEYACPTRPKSIYVEGNLEHILADEPVIEELEINIDYKEDFPF